MSLSVCKATTGCRSRVLCKLFARCMALFAARCAQ
jgi:hypothetical protein